MVLEMDTVGRLEEFDEKPHWSSDMVMHQLQEPARGLTTRRDLLIVAFYAHTDKVVKIGQDKQYNLTAMEGASRFLADHFNLRRVGIQSLITTTSHGAKFLVDVTEESNAAVWMLPTELMKLTKGVGMEVSKLGDPMNTINMSVAYPSWADVTELERAVKRVTWVKKVEHVKRVKLCEGSVTTNHVVFKVTPLMDKPVGEMSINGKAEEQRVASDLFEMAKWTWKLSFGGYNLRVTRANSCAFCGYDDHLTNNCHASLRLLSDNTPLFSSRMTPKSVQTGGGITAVDEPVPSTSQSEKAKGPKPKGKVTGKKPRKGLNPKAKTKED